MIYAFVKNGKIARLIEDKTHTMFDFETAKAKRATEEKYRGVDFVLLDDLDREALARAIMEKQRDGDILTEVCHRLALVKDELTDILDVVGVDDD